MLIYKEQDMSKTINVEGIGDVTIVKTMMVDTMGQAEKREEAKRFAEEYAESHNLKVIMSRTAIGRWYEKGVGMAFEFAEGSDYDTAENFRKRFGTWYAVCTDDEDADWGYGSYDKEEAFKMLKGYPAGHIDVVEMGNDPICIEVLYNED